MKILDTQMSFEAAAWIVTWAAVAMLALIAGNLHARVRRLEAASIAGRRQSAYRHLLGRRLDDELGPRLYLLLSAHCEACRAIAGRLEMVSWRLSTTVAWTDQDPGQRPLLPATVQVSVNGKGLAEQLGVQASPFALFVGASGRVERAFPVSSIEPLLELAQNGAGLEMAAAPIH